MMYPGRTADPVMDAERYMDYLDTAYPIRDGIVEVKLTLCLRVEGRGEDEWLDEADRVIKRLTGDPAVWEWDVEDKKAEEY